MIITKHSGGCRAWSKALDSGSSLVGVRGFKSLPPHRSIDFFTLTFLAGIYRVCNWIGLVKPTNKVHATVSRQVYICGRVCGIHVSPNRKKTSNNRHSRSSADFPLNPNVTGNYGYEPPWLVIFRRNKKEAKKMNKHHDEKGIAADLNSVNNFCLHI